MIDNSIVFIIIIIIIIFTPTSQSTRTHIIIHNIHFNVLLNMFIIERLFKSLSEFVFLYTLINLNN